MAESAKANPKQADAIIAAAFQQYLDDWTQLRQQGLIYCEFRSTKKEGIDALQRDNTISLLEQFIVEGYVEVFPITYEDFLPFSATGIFQSDLQSQGPAENSLRLQQSNANPEGFERALQDKVMDIDEWYSCIQNQSLEAVCCGLGLRIEQLA